MTVMTVILFNSVLIVLLLGFISYQVRNIWDANNFIHIEIKKVLNELLEDFSVAKMHDHQLLRKIQAYSDLLEQTDNKEGAYLHKRLDVLIENSTFAVERLDILFKLVDEHFNPRSEQIYKLPTDNEKSANSVSITEGRTDVTDGTLPEGAIIMQ